MLRVWEETDLDAGWHIALWYPTPSGSTYISLTLKRHPASRRRIRLFVSDDRPRPLIARFEVEKITLMNPRTAQELHDAARVRLDGALRILGTFLHEQLLEVTLRKGLLLEPRVFGELGQFDAELHVWSIHLPTARSRRRCLRRGL